MPVGKITADGIKVLVPNGEVQILWDDKLSGFGAKMSKGGALTYIVQYRLGGRGTPTKRYTIGGPDKGWKPYTAREEAEALLRRVSQGEDIAGAKKEAVVAAAEAKKVAEELAFSAYVDRFAETKLKSKWPKSWRQTKACLVKHAVSRWAEKPLPSITKADITKALSALDERPATKRNLYAALSYMFGQALLDDDIAVNPITSVEAPPMVAARSHTLNHDELRWLWQSTFELPHPYGPIYRLFAVLGQRRSEIGGMDWKELNRTAAEWHIPAERAKNGTETIVPLPHSVIEMLDKVVWKDRWPHHGLVFPSRAGTPPSGFSKTKKLLDAKMAKVAKAEDGIVRPWRTHDLRRTLATNMQSMGFAFEVVEHLLNHKEKSRTGIGAVYQTHAFKPEKRAAIEKWEAKLQQIVGGKEAVVIPFERRA